VTRHRQAPESPRRLEMETPTSIATLARDAHHDDQLALIAARRIQTDGAGARWPLPGPSWPWDPPGLHGHSIGRHRTRLDTIASPSCAFAVLDV
jgi:hypothetical protein